MGVMNERDITGPDGRRRPDADFRTPETAPAPAPQPDPAPRGDVPARRGPAEPATRETPAVNADEPADRGRRKNRRDRDNARDTARDTEPAPRRGGAASSTWVALIVGALLLILLLVFIMQNQQSVELHLFGWTWNFPLGVGLLLASIIGGLIMACAAIWKMVEMRRRP